jgi:hypothetical protein
MSTFTDRITKLATKLDTIDTKITTLQGERTSIVAEMANIIGGDNTPTSVAKTTTTKVQKKGQLGLSIYEYLVKNPGKPLAAISKAMGAEAKRVGLSIYHLTEKGQVFSDKGVYYPAVDVGASAKTAPTTADGNDDEEEVPF